MATSPLVLKDAKAKVMPVDYVHVLMHYLEKQGYSPQDILTRAGISLEIFSNPKARISYIQYESLVGLILEIAQQPHIGLYLGREINLMAHGELGIALMSSTTVAEAIEIGQKYVRTRKPFFRVTSEAKNGSYEIRIETIETEKWMHDYLVDTMLANIHAMRQFFLGSQCGDCEVFFDYSKPDNIALYQEIFSAKLHFDQPYSGYLFPMTELDIHLPLANPLTCKIAQEQCSKILKQLSGKEDIVSQVQQILIARPGFFPNLVDVAARLFMSPRTLRRKLQEADTSYQEVLDNLRKKLALNYLRSSDMSIADIADLLDFSDPSNFANAFKKWTGKAPSHFRE